MKRVSLHDAQQCRLPIDDFHDEIVQKADANDVLIITGDTGSGKSTRVPRALLDTAHAQSNTQKFIVATQPRRIAAQTLARRVGNDLGRERVGHAVGKDRSFNERTVDVLFSTCGWLATKLVHNFEWALRNISFVVIDEAHERDVDMDLLCFLCRLLLKSPDCTTKVVLMSATIDVGVFQDYFLEFTLQNVDICMRRYPVDIFYVRGAQCDRHNAVCAEAQALLTKADDAQSAHVCESLMVRAGALVCRNLADKMQRSTTVLVFLSGMSAIDDFYTLLEQHEETRLQQKHKQQQGRRYDIHVLHSAIDPSEQMAVFKADAGDEEPRLRIVLATNIAESSVTMPGVEFVLDLGLQKVLRHDDEADVQELSLQRISRASANQRAGRTGRVCPGTVLRFYSAYEFEWAMRMHSEPEIRLIALERILLRFYALKKSSSLDALKKPLECLNSLVEPPSCYSVESAQTRLLEIAALQTQCAVSSDTISNHGHYGQSIDLEDTCSAEEKELRERLQSLSTTKQDLEAAITALIEPQSMASSTESGDGAPKSFAAIMREQEMEQKKSRANAKKAQKLRCDVEKVRKSIDVIERELERFEEVAAERRSKARLQHALEKADMEMQQRLAEKSGAAVDITAFGLLLMQVPLSFAHAKFVLFGAQFGVILPHFVVMGALLSVQGGLFISPYNKDRDKQRFFDQTRRLVHGIRRFSLPHASDLIAAVGVFVEISRLHGERSKLARFLHANGLHKGRTMQFYRTALSVFSRLAQGGFGIADSVLGLLRQKAVDCTALQTFFDCQGATGRALSLVIALALEKNLLTPSPKKRNERNQWCQIAEDDTISFYFRVEAQADTKDADPRIWLRREIENSLFLLKPGEPLVCTLQNCTDVTELLFYRVVCTPLDLQGAQHVLRQLAMRGPVNVPLQLPAKSKIPRFATLSDVSGAAVIDWTRDGVFVYDFPPRSLLLNLLDNETGVAEQLSWTETASSSVSLRAAKPLVVAADFTWTARKLRASAFSLVPQEVTAQFLMLRNAAAGTLNAPRASILTEESEERYSVVIGSDMYTHCCSAKEKEQLYALFARCAGLADALHNWTLADIGNETRSTDMWSILISIL